jgi:small subunit ribosomal protein S2
MSELLGTFIIGILSGWLMEWLFVRLFVPNPKKKVEVALQASRKEVENLQKQNRELQASVVSLKTEQTTPPPQAAAPIQAETTDAEAATAEATTAEPVAVEADAVEAVTVDAETTKDDLTRLSGIGPKLAEAMTSAGITSYAQLAAMDSDTLAQALSESGARYNKTTAETWAAQATLAANGDWKGLKEYQAAAKS